MKPEIDRYMHYDDFSCPEVNAEIKVYVNLSDELTKGKKIRGQL